MTNEKKKAWRECNLAMGLTLLDDDSEEMLRRLDEQDGYTKPQWSGCDAPGFADENHPMIRKNKAKQK